MELKFDDIIKLNHLKNDKFNGIDLYFSKDTRFKKCYFRIDSYIPYDPLDYLYYGVLCNLMSKSSFDFPKEEDFRYQLDDFYAANYYANFKIENNVVIFSFLCSFISPRFVEDKNYLANIIHFVINSITKTDFTKLKFDFTIKEAKMYYSNSHQDPSLISYEGFKSQMFINEKSVEYLKYNANSYDLLTLTKLENVYNKVINGYSLMYLCGDLNYAFVKKVFKGIDFSKFNSFSNHNDLDFDYPKSYLKKEPLMVNEFYNSNQGFLYLGFKTDYNFKNDYQKRITCFLFNMMFGEYFGSALNMVIREKLGLCYSINSSFAVDKSSIIIYTTINKDNYELVVDEIKKLFNNYQNGLFTIKHLKTCKKIYHNEINTSKDNYDECFAKLYQYLRNYSVHSSDEFNSVLKNITKDDIIEMAKLFSLDTVYFMRKKD